jgi:hypothetical protein
MNRINKFNDKTTFGDLFNNLPIKKLWVIKSPEIWSDWSKTGVIECTKNITTSGKTGIQIPDIEPYIDGFFDVDDYHSHMIQDNIDGFYLFSDQFAAYNFFEYLKEEY